MDMTGEYRIPASRDRVWAALNDPDVLKQAIPGCEELKRVSDDELEATVRAKIGPVSARFAGKVTLSDLNPPESYRISGEGKGGAAGFAKGGANVNLEDEGESTLLRYTAQAEVGGKLAQIGSRLVQGSAKKMADDFFGRFAAIVSGEGAEGGTAAMGEPTKTNGSTAAPTATSAPSRPEPTAQTGGIEAKGTTPADEGAASSQIARDPIGAEFPGTVGLDRPSADPDTGRVAEENASIDAGATATANEALNARAGHEDRPAATTSRTDGTRARESDPAAAAATTAARGGAAGPIAGAPAARTGTAASEPKPQANWYANPILWVAVLAIIVVLIFAFS